jgi:hypothetical protein
MKKHLLEECQLAAKGIKEFSQKSHKCELHFQKDDSSRKCFYSYVLDRSNIPDEEITILNCLYFVWRVFKCN